MRRVGDGQLPRPFPSVLGNKHPVVVDGDGLQTRCHVHDSTDHGWVDGVVVAESANVVVPGQANTVAKHHLRFHRRQGPHRRAVDADQITGPAAPRPGHSGVRDRQPRTQLLVEIVRRGERPAGHEPAAEEAIHPLDHPLGLRVAGLQKLDLSAEGAGERGSRLGEFPPADSGLVVPRQPGRNRLRFLQQRPHPTE